MPMTSAIIHYSLKKLFIIPMFLPPPYHVPCRLLRWLFRFRHRQGYGIHSPFAFHFVTNVVYESGAYYAYPELDRLWQQARCGGHTILRRKDCRLLFRLANYVRPVQAVAVGIGSQSVEMACMCAGSRHTEWIEEGLSADWVVAMKAWEHRAVALLDYVRPGGMLLLYGVGRNAESRKAWQQLLQQPAAQVSFDLYDWGVICCRPELQRQHYVVNYL